jgi:hypothetical protein
MVIAAWTPAARLENSKSNAFHGCMIRPILATAFTNHTAPTLRGKNGFVRLRHVIICFLAAVCATLTGMPAAGQTRANQGAVAEKTLAPGPFPPYRAPRTADGKPDLNGIWQAFVTADIDIQDHDAQAGPHPDIMGAYGAWPGGQGIVEGGEIPYKPEALAKKKENAEKRMVVNITSDPHRHDTGDPELKCYRPGVPRANYMPFPFQIIETPRVIVMAYEYARALRTIYMDNDKTIAADPPADSWMGWSHGHFEGDTLVVDSKGFVPYSWFDRAGDYHSDALHVVERYTPVSPYHIMYEATIEDPNVFTRPWKMSFPLYRRMEKNIQLVDFNCTEFVLDLLYGQYSKQ